MKLKIIPKTKKEKEKLHKQKSNSSLSGKSSSFFKKNVDFFSSSVFQVGLRKKIDN